MIIGQPYCEFTFKQQSKLEKIIKWEQNKFAWFPIKLADGRWLFLNKYKRKLFVKECGQKINWKKEETKEHSNQPITRLIYYNTI